MTIDAALLYAEIQHGKTYYEIGQHYGLTPNAVRKRVSRYLKKQRTKALNAFLDQAPPPTPPIFKPAVIPSKKRKVIGAGDIHANPDQAITLAIIQEQPDIIIVGGDLLNSAQVSGHPLDYGERREKLKHEIQVCRTWLTALLQNTTAQIFIIRGNHDDWWHRRISSVIDPELLFLISDPLQMIVEGLPRISLVNTPLAFTTPNGTQYPAGSLQYMVIVGDALISHANFTSKNPGGAVKKLSTYITDWKPLLTWPDFRLLIQFHGHKISCNIERGGYLTLIEPGMVGELSVEAYKIGYQAKWTPGAIGCVVFEQEENKGQWVTIQQSIRVVQPPPNKIAMVAAIAI